MHALTTYHWALIGRSNRCKEDTTLNIHCIPMHLAISGLDLVNVYGSAPELKQSSRTWQQKEAKFLVFGLWGTASQPNFFQRWCRFTWAFLAQIIIFNGLKRGLKLKISKPKNVFRFKNIIFFDDTPHFWILEVKILQCVRSWRLWVRQCLICLYGRTATGYYTLYLEPKLPRFPPFRLRLWLRAKCSGGCGSSFGCTSRVSAILKQPTAIMPRFG